MGDIVDMSTWINNKMKGETDRPAQHDKQSAKTECPPCPKCEPKPKYLRINTEQLLYDIAMDGLVVNEDKAKQGPCKCVETDDGNKICWDKGIIGVLSQDQTKKYCDNVDDYKLSKKLSKDADNLTNASERCEIGKTYSGSKINNIEDRLRCMASSAGGGIA